MFAVTQVRNVFGVAVKEDLEACIAWLHEQVSEFQIFFPDEYVSALGNGMAENEFQGPWLIFISDDTVAVAFKLKFC